jgi:hypothetical protein
MARIAIVSWQRWAAEACLKTGWPGMVRNNPGFGSGIFERAFQMQAQYNMTSQHGFLSKFI